MTSTSNVNVPARRARPGNRRELILAAAAELFARKGYPQVGMAAIAEVVGVRPSALYRHFASKEELLREAISAPFQPTLDVLDQAADEPFGRIVSTLANVTLDHRWAGVLWQRESRHLPPTARTELMGAFQTSVDVLGKALGRNRPELSALQTELLAWSVMTVVISASFYPPQRSRKDDERLLASLAQTAANASVPMIERSPSLRPQGGLTFRSRRESLLSAAISLFAENGSAAVSLEEVGASVGIAGPSIYSHFASKSDLLAMAFRRGDEVLRMEMSQALSGAVDAGDALVRLLKSYTSFAFSSVDLIQLLRAEVPQLPDVERRVYVQSQREYIDEWVYLMRAVQPSQSSIVADIRVRTALNVVNGIARRPHLRGGRGVADALEVIGRDLLQLTPIPQPSES